MSTKKRQQRLPWLTFKQHLFVAAFTGPARGNATKAAELAGYRGSDASLAAHASRLVRNGNVAKAIEQLTAECRERLQANGDRELALLEELQEFTVLDLYDGNGAPIKIHLLPRKIAAAIKGIRPTRYGTVLEFHDKVRPIELRLRAFGRLVDKHQVEAGGTLESLLAALAARTSTDGQ
jgi:hypothetical protein